MVNNVRGVVGWVAIALVALVGMATPAAALAAPERDEASVIHASAAVPAVAPLPAVLDDFTFESFDAVYDLGRDDEGHSTLSTRETLVAVFPDYDQNRGIVRVLPKRYQGEPTELTIVSITDENGVRKAYESEDDDNGNLVLTIRGSEYLHGRNTFVISYTQRYVTDYFADTNDDEFYWDVNGTGWGQPFGRVSARVTLADDLVPALTGDAACYRGYEGATDRCEIVRTGDAFEASAADLGAYQGMTIAIGFTAHTFVPRDSSVFGNWAPIGQLVSLGAALVVFILAVVTRVTRWRDHPGRGVVIPEYDEPGQDGFFIYSNLLRTVGTNKALVATVLRLAVDGAIVILDDATAEQATGRTLRGKFSALPLDRARVQDADDLAVYDAMFPGNVAIPFEFVTNTAFGAAVTKLSAHLRARVVQLGYRRTIREPAKAWLILAGIALLIAGGALGAISLATVVGGGWSIAMLVGAIVVGVLTVVLVASASPLTEKGARNAEYLRGLKMFIDWAEKDRLVYLQSPEGAERRKSSTPLGETEVLHIHERLLPYAAFFGQEKRWVNELGRLYETTGSQPDWYHGSRSFSAAAFAVALSSASTSMSRSFSSSGSGGSGGGGSSGGGGGGGGGGGA